ncbi:hypothetical protein PtrSN002B_008601 [Pyrenophora tritici-repentis]|uniref:Uncharacterized protein n=2 Tax=Pyrenophora tritici-repentis TaxID=45151 RepID=A0A2W1GJB3_9PLEO|nr:uncharacterized protein PTRG_02923 [Pyrenophora tritici-repentis Pt-1C-BFP]KAA8623001.1 hypothetical protein PtrV1_04307 [Pyrenophora tritici-repentis]EDU45446.1 predicted protein [Pyrenophora tritici-repentis Pt-1C-BFP]KAF7451990.1 hypothetical protein A1F99_037670 [Pyrenophora tritici-repentis]KAF7574889.1 hypothetical protein PtrM4_065130 [Pyrenophora tritici-repentis]KAG9386345.1 hypothetical protein A1F94_003095 [Pyrenophora tritici-repentis]
MVDRYVAFIYIGSFTMDKNGQASYLHHITKLPPGKTETDFAMAIETAVHFYLIMYGMGERLQDEGLMDIAHAKMAEDLLCESPMPLLLVTQIVGWVYGTKEKICRDEKRELGNLAVACVLRYVKLKFWTVSQTSVFTAAVAQHGVFVAEMNVAGPLSKELEKKWPNVKKREHNDGQASKKQVT